ncbi:hypothetical protein [Pseudomonas savastanoi]|uniref:hypothetical protein n=1 Tax=Pseudomonas savastanoi TaxID=29438 RepID=UPI001CE2ECDD|nr:hypothetical protein [Pseudomonas savastanoi]
MIAADEFQSFTASVFPSQDGEIVINKQPVLADYGRELRSAINQLPPEVTRDLLGEYGEPTPALLTSIEDAVTLREFAIENAAKETNLDQGWLNGVAPREIDEPNIGAEDLWNAPEI